MCCDVLQSDALYDNHQDSLNLGSKNNKVVLSALVVHPIELHVNCQSAFLLDSLIQDATCCGIICHRQCGNLRVVHLF